MADDIGNLISGLFGILTLKQWIIAAIIVFALWKLTSKKEKFATTDVKTLVDTANSYNTRYMFMK